MLQKLKSLFGQNEKPSLAALAPAVPTFFDMTIGRTVEIDPLVFKLRPKGSLFKAPSPTLVIVAQGIVQLEDGSFVHRFYTEDHTMVQIVSGAREGDGTVSDMTVFTPYDTFEPSRDSEFDAWREKISQTCFSIDGKSFSRLWFEHSDLPEPPVQFNEAIHEDRTGPAERSIHQTCMLFARDIEDERELLLVTIENPTMGDRIVSQMIGIALDPSQISI